MILGLFFFMSSSLSAQQYVNGNLSTGATSSNGVAAPSGYTWSEIQTGNINAGFGAQTANNVSLADDFTIASGSWTVNKVTFFAYSTGYAGTTSPFEVLRFQIFNTDPSVGSPTPIYGDLTTNRLTSSTSSGIYRIFNALPGTTREIWKLEANINTVLPPGTYWIEWQTGVNAALTSNFNPSSTVVGTTTQAGNNAKQHDLTGNTWAGVADGTTIPNNFQDFHFIINYSTTSCTGTPDPGTTTSSVTTACVGVPVNLGVTNPVSGLGITYQWQSSSDNVTYTNIAGATNSAYTTSITGSTWFRLAITCAGSGNIGYSTPILVTQTPPSGCYCSSSSTSTADEEIFRVKIGTLDNASTCSTVAPGFGSVQNKYSNYTSGVGAPAPGVIVSGGANPISITVGTCGGNFTNNTAVWIDYNQNGTFESSEKVYASAAGTQGPHTETGNAVVPSTATLGNTVMRVVTVETFSAANITPCGTYTWGETEDYLVNIRACVPVRVTTQPSSAAAPCGGAVSFTVGTSGDNPSFTWEQRTSAAANWTFVTNGGMFSGATTNTLTITGATNSMNGYQYRAVFTGSCTATDFSSLATLTVQPLIAIVAPTSANICNGSSQQLQIQNSASASVTTSVASGTLNTIITDGDPSGIMTPGINISGIPSNAVISDISVKLNINHTWVGDIDINLIAPNGQNLNLVGALNNGAGSNSTDNFVNTIISSTSTTAISGAAAPRTGTFAAEKRAGYGPLGNEQTATDWPALIATPNGDWKLAIADNGFGDEGTLVDWSVTITYSSPVLATGTWSPTTTLFTDAALTTPYTGTAVSTVYAAPTTSTEYAVVVQTPTCTSAPFVIPVTVSNPVGPLLQPSDKEVCENGSVTFNAGSESGNPLEYQWQVSTDNGTTFTDITDGGVYSGANSDALTITGATTSMDGYQYQLTISVGACNSNATTQTVTLTVHANPSLNISVAPYTSLYPGLQSTLTANVTPSGGTNTYVWTLNGADLAGSAATHNVDIDGLGTYSVSVTDQNGCGATATNTITITDSLNKALFVYPNPNRGIFQVRYNDKLNGVSNPRTITVYDSKGARVYRSRFTPNFPFGKMEVNLSKEAKGVYYIDLTDAAGKRLQSERVVIF
jgi:subtilisin-like proprotein convertase family protein